VEVTDCEMFQDQYILHEITVEKFEKIPKFVGKYPSCKKVLTPKVL
jgi:hypothetical protein